MERARPAGAFDFLILAIDRVVHAGDRDRVIAADQAVAIAEQLRDGRLLAGQQIDDGGRAQHALDESRESRFRHGAGDRGVADHVDVALPL